MSCFPLSHNESVKEVGEYGLRRKEYTVWIINCKFMLLLD